MKWRMMMKKERTQSVVQAVLKETGKSRKEGRRMMCKVEIINALFVRRLICLIQLCIHIWRINMQRDLMDNPYFHLTLEEAEEDRRRMPMESGFHILNPLMMSSLRQRIRWEAHWILLLALRKCTLRSILKELRWLRRIWIWMRESRLKRRRTMRMRRWRMKWMISWMGET